MIQSVLSPQRVYLDLKPQPKGELLREMTSRLAHSGQIAQPDVVSAALIRREAMITTAVKQGFAFPHAFIEHLSDMILTVGVIDEGTDYQSLDGAPVEFVFLLLGPPQRQDVHLRMLARLSHITSVPGIIEALREAKTPESFIEVLTQADRQIASRA